MGAVRNALQASPFPLRRRTLRLGFFRSRTPCASPLVTPPPSEGREHSGEVEGVSRVVSCEVPPPSSLHSGGGAVRALASAGMGDSAASSLPGEGVAGSSHSQESLVLADSDPVASSSSPGGDCRSRSGGRGDYRRPLPLFPLISCSGSTRASLCPLSVSS